MTQSQRTDRPAARQASLLEADEASRIAHDLTERYGRGALEFARSRAARTVEIGDDLAYGAWQAIITAVHKSLGPIPARPGVAASAYRRGSNAAHANALQPLWDVSGLS